MKALRYVAVATISSVALVAASSALFCHASLRVPRRAGADASLAPGAAAVAIRAHDGVELRGLYMAPRTKTAGCVLVLHGVGDSVVGSAGFAPMFLDAGYAVLLPDARGHGSSGGDIVTYGLLEKHDALRWADWSRQQGCSRIYALGESLGGAVLIQSAAIEPVFRAIVAECPYADLQSIAEYRVQYVGGIPKPLSSLIVAGAMTYARLWYGLNFADVSPAACLAKTSTPVLLIHGQDDYLTPPSHSELLAKANPAAALWLVPRAGHVAASFTSPDEFRRRVLDWFARH